MRKKLDLKQKTQELPLKRILAHELLQKVWVLRKLLYPMDDMEAMEFLVDKIRRGG